MKKLLIFLLLVVGLSRLCVANEQIRLIQEELRKRNLYFGEIDGQKTEETKRALRQFQQRKGFSVTGDPDQDTLNALNLGGAGRTAAGSPVEGEQWPEMPVLRSDAAWEMKEEDKKYLESLNPVAEPPSDEPLPEALQETVKSPTGQSAAPLVNKQNSQDKQSGHASPAPTVSPKNAAAVADNDRSSTISSERVGEFVRSYLDACETNRLASEIAYYADQVKYFDHGVVSRDFIERDVTAFYRRWPERDYELLDLKVLQSNSNEAIVKFRIGFRYLGAQHSVSGKTDNIFTMRRTDEGLKYTTLREQRLRN